jgi:hypothetical protein
MAENKKADKAAAEQPAAETAVKTKVQEAIEIIAEHAPHVKTAWINDNGEYHFHKRPGFKKYILQKEDEPADEVEEAVTVNVPAGKPNDNLEF